jgi:subtilase family protein/purple acid phosphatase-like protein
MRWRALLAVTVTVLSVAPAIRASRPHGAADARGKIAAQYRVTKATPAGKTVRLAVVAFDPAQRVPKTPKGLAADRASARHWLVQMRGPVTTSARAAVERAGARVIGYLADYTLVVASTPDVADGLKGLSAVRWVGVYHPWYKLSPDLNRLKFASGRLRVFVHRDVAPASVAASLRRIDGVQVAEVGSRMVTVAGTRAALAPIARIDDVSWVEQVPHYRLLNNNARWVNDTGMRGEYAVTLPGRLDGAGQTAAVADTGINYIKDANGRAQAAFSDCDAAGDCELADYIQKVPGSSVEALGSLKATGTHHRKMAGYFNLDEDDPLPRSMEPSWHGTHTAGSIAGDYPDENGIYGTHSRESDGIAPAARLIFQDIEADGGLGGLPGLPYDLFNQVYDLNGNGKYDPLFDARTHNNSYGAIYPELDDGGGASTDDFVYDHPDMVVVFSASNDGPDPATLAGGPQESKNILTSCAAANGSQPLVAPDAVAIFSSHGPTLDGRLKPDVCTPGQIIVSPKGGTVDADQYLQGTSMSGPILVGLSTLVRQYYWDGFGPAGGARGFARGVRDLKDRHNPSAALVKATIIDSAQRMRGWYSGDAGGERSQDGMWPSNGQGFGKVELDRALYFLGDDEALFAVDTPNGVAGKGIETGIEISEFIDVAEGKPLDVTLTWTDPSSALIAGSPVLVNDLDLEVVAPDGTTYNGNEFNTQTPLLGPGGDASLGTGEESSVPGGVADRANTVERFHLPHPQTGRYKVTVRGANVPEGPSGYALVASGRIAADTTRIVSERAEAKPGSDVGAYLLGTGLTGDTIAGFKRVAPSIYHRTAKATAPELVLSAAGATTRVPVDSQAPAASGVVADSIASDLARIEWSTDELSTGMVKVTGPDGKSLEYPDVHVSNGLQGLETPQNETKGVYLDRPVVSTKHFINATGLQPGVMYRYEIHTTDRAGNTHVAKTGSFVSTASVFSPRASDIAQLIADDTTTGLPETDAQQWGTSTQMYAGTFATTVPDLVFGVAGITGSVPYQLRTTPSMPAFMFRLPASVDPKRITGAAVELMSGHDIVNVYEKPAVYSMDLLDSGVEDSWGPGTTYDQVDQADADAHLSPDPTERRGAGTAYAFHVPCNEISAFRANLAEDSGSERRAAFRLRGLTESIESLFSFETGYGRRSRGPQLRPRLVLYLDGQDPQVCNATTAPKIKGVLVDHTSSDSAVVSWQTDVPSDSTVFFRLAGTKAWTPVSAPVRVTQHFIRIEGLKPNGAYEFTVRSATCNGLATVDTNHGKAYALWNDAFIGPEVFGVHSFPSADDLTAQVVKWSTDQKGNSVVEYGTSPSNLDKRAAAPPADGQETEEPTAAHEVTITGLQPCTRYFFRVATANVAGKVSHSRIYAFDRPPANLNVVKGWTFDSSDEGFVAGPPSGHEDPLLGIPDSGTETKWARGNDPRVNGSGAWRTVVQPANQPGYTSNADVRVVSPPVKMPAAGFQFVRFNEWYLFEGAFGSTEQFEKPEVEISYDDGHNWVSVRSKIVGSNPDSPAATSTTLPLPRDTAGQTIRFGFRFRSDPGLDVPAGGGWAIDDVQTMNGVCANLAGAHAAGAASVPMAPEKPSAERAPAQAAGIVGAIPPVAGLSGAGTLPNANAVPSAKSIAAGTCRCSVVRFQRATAGPRVLPSKIPAKPSEPRGRGVLPATGLGSTPWVLVAAIFMGLAVRRTTRRHPI